MEFKRTNSIKNYFESTIFMVDIIQFKKVESIKNSINSKPIQLKANSISIRYNEILSKIRYNSIQDQPKQRPQIQPPIKRGEVSCSRNKVWV